MKIWIRKPVSLKMRSLLGVLCVLGVLGIWFLLTTADVPERRIVSINTLPNPAEVVMAFPSLIAGVKPRADFVLRFDAPINLKDCLTPAEETPFTWDRSVFMAIWLSLSRELMAFSVVLLLAFPLGIFMSTQNRVRSFFYPLLIIGSFIPIAALLPLTQTLFGIGELQKIMFLSLGMFFVLLGLIIKEMDEVDEIYLQTAYTLGFKSLKTVFLVIFPTALPRIWKHLSAVFGLGWGYIIFAELINTGGGDVVSGIGWLFTARSRRNQAADKFAIIIIIVVLAFLFSFLFKAAGRLFFRHERGENAG